MKPTKRKKQGIRSRGRPAPFRCFMDESSTYGDFGVLEAINGPYRGPSVLLTQWVIKRNSGKRLRFGSQTHSASTGERLDAYAPPQKFMPAQVVRRQR